MTRQPSSNTSLRSALRSISVLSAKVTCLAVAPVGDAAAVAVDGGAPPAPPNIPKAPPPPPGPRPAPPLVLGGAGGTRTGELPSATLTVYMPLVDSPAASGPPWPVGAAE